MKKVLIADNQAAGRELIRIVVEACGYEVIEASDGTEAIRMARESGPDLVVLDLPMPGMDGFGVVREIRADSRLAEKPVMALTGSAMQGDRELALLAGFDSYITKPALIRELRAEVRRLLTEGRGKQS
jgi:CheY-like chemotaxis protein